MYIMLLLTISAFSSVDPNAFPYAHWLEPAAWSEKVYYYPAANDPNLLCKITKTEVIHYFNLSDWNIYAQQYPGDPNYVSPVSGYYLCLKCKDNLYHVKYPGCTVTKGYKMEPILAKDLKQYTPCPVCLPKPPEPNEPTLAEVLAGVTDPNLASFIRSLMEKQ